MAEYLAPGVFVEEIDSGSKPIEGVGINTVAFIGYAKSGDFNKPTFISNWSQFCQMFGEDESLLVSALSSELGKTPTELLNAKRASRKGWMEYAQTSLNSAVREASTRNGSANGNGHANGALAVKNWPEFLRKYRIPQSSLPYMEGAYLAHAVRGYYDNGGGRAYIIRVARPEDLKALGANDAQAATPPDTKAVAAVPAQRAFGPFTIQARRAGAAGNDIKVEIEPTGTNDEFRVKVSQGEQSESFGLKDKPISPANFPETLNAGAARSKLVQVEVKDGVALRLEPQVFSLEGGLDATTLAVANPASTAMAPIGNPLNGLASVQPDDFIGDEAQRTGISGLAPIEDINMVCAPDLMAGVWRREPSVGDGTGPGPEVLALSPARQQAILDAQCALVSYCERSGDRMAILDPLPGQTPQQMRDVCLSTPFNCDHGQAAIYYPWIRVADPLHRGQQMFVPPSGHIAGVWSRVGVERGVHKAPANEALMGAVALEFDITKGEQEILNPDGINCIRAFPGRGIRVWGARTLATVGNPSWKYVNVRRLFNYLERSMDRGLQWVVFEPNDQDLWGRVRRNLSAFLWTEWKEGKLFGSVAEEAFYVKCDAETNPQEMIDLGRLYVEIGLNPVKPAEFVIVRIGQWSATSSMNEA